MSKQEKGRRGRPATKKHRDEEYETEEDTLKAKTQVKNNQGSQSGQNERSRTRNRDDKTDYHHNQQQLQTRQKDRALQDDYDNSKKRGRSCRTKPLENKKQGNVIGEEDEEDDLENFNKSNSKRSRREERESQKTLSEDEDYENERMDSREDDDIFQMDDTQSKSKNKDDQEEKYDDLTQELNNTINKDDETYSQESQVSLKKNVKETVKQPPSGRGKRGRPGRKPAVEVTQQQEKEKPQPPATLSKDSKLTKKQQILILRKNLIKNWSKKKSNQIYDERQSLKFKSPHWVKQQALKKSNVKVHLYKNLKQILTNFDNNPQNANNQESSKDQGPQYNQEIGSYMSIDCGISVRVQPKYCDFTGFFSKYKHKVCGLRYTEDWQYQMIDKMQNSKIEEYLQQRKAFVFLK
ncbi:UNKNOWN [Stylonychia lemnae]|uniref:Uncharacterized protein n=1 Tax=Stylonychia lemnae TaxID=5949 RepID=A0A078A2Z2_STYLE|nr:UNKNOWN [Stylonychia lemnae]|eukprot:CDW75139.1 UNKNOWN [Stylonychia lemnae]